MQERTGQIPAPRSVAQDQAGVSQSKSEEMYAYADHLSYGKITDVNYAKYQVKVSLFNDVPHPELEKNWQPLITQQDEIFLRWGQLRIGMVCRVHWTGRKQALRGFVEIIGDENTSFVEQEDRENNVPTRPYKFLGGGFTAF